jgi:group I intron endonuclease
MVGIYKITNPNGKVYIGQSVNLEKRKKNYNKLRDCKNQKKLYSSLVKYSFSDHIFEVIEECEVTKLNIRERYWQDYYNVLEEGLNLKLTKTDDRSGYLSQEVRDRMRESRIGKKHSQETIDKIKGMRGPMSEQAKANLRVPKGPQKKSSRSKRSST